MSSAWDTGYTVASILLSGLLLLFIVPAMSYILLQGFSYMLTPTKVLCDNVLRNCVVKNMTVTTMYGDVTVSVTKVEETSVVASFANISVDLLLALLQLVSRMEVMMAAFMVDLITLAYEISD